MFCEQQQMYSFSTAVAAAALLLLATITASAFVLPDTHHHSSLDRQRSQQPISVASVPATAPASHNNFYFPCEDLQLDYYLYNLELERVRGRWYTVNQAVAVLDSVGSPYDVQQHINQHVNCVWSTITTPDDGGKTNSTSLVHLAAKATEKKTGDNGWWLVNQTSPDGLSSFAQDLYWVATDYTNFNIQYSCVDFPVPGGGTAAANETHRLQYWTVQRRTPEQFSDEELAAIKLLIESRSINHGSKLGHLYSIPTNKCWLYAPKP